MKLRTYYPVSGGMEDARTRVGLGRDRANVPLGAES